MLLRLGACNLVHVEITVLLLCEEHYHGDDNDFNDGYGDGDDDSNNRISDDNGHGDDNVYSDHVPRADPAVTAKLHVLRKMRKKLLRPKGGATGWTARLCKSKTSARKKAFRALCSTSSQAGTMKTSFVHLVIKTPDRPTQGNGDTQDTEVKAHYQQNAEEDWLSTVRFKPIPNPVSFHCWWSASSVFTHLPPHVALAYVQQHASHLQGLPAEVCESLSKLSTNESQVQVAVNALAEFYDAGLLIWHVPANGVYIFLPNANKPVFVSCTRAAAWLQRRPCSHIMRYTEIDGRGHYEACAPSPADSCSSMPLAQDTFASPSDEPLSSQELARHVQMLRSLSRQRCMFLQSAPTQIKLIILSFALESEKLGLLPWAPISPTLPYTPAASLAMFWEPFSKLDNFVPADLVLPWTPNALPVPDASPSYTAGAEDSLLSLAPTQLDSSSPMCPTTAADLTSPSTNTFLKNWGLSSPPMSGGSSPIGSGIIDLSDSPAGVPDLVNNDVQAIMSRCPMHVPRHIALRASRRFPGDVERAVAEACSLMFSPASAERGRSPRRSLQASTRPEGVHTMDQSVPESVSGDGAGFSTSDVAAAPPAADLRPSIGVAPPDQSVPRSAANASAPGSAACPRPDPPHLQDPLERFWQARRQAVDEAAKKLYEAHLQIDPRNTQALRDLFLDLPIDSPVTAQQFGLSLEEVMHAEIKLFEQRARDSTSFTSAIADAWNTPLDVVKLLPFFAAVLCIFAEETGIARELPFGFLTALAGWCSHKNLHACFDPRKPEDEVRACAFIVLLGASNAGKSPFFRKCVDAVFTSKDGQPSLVEVLADLFIPCSDGKTLLVSQATNADFAKRMKDTLGHLFWASEEAWGMLDVAWAQGKSRVPMSDRKIQHCYLLNTQNGWSYGPLSIKSEQHFVPSTNFAMFHAGQAKVIHDYWGQVYLPGCPFADMGWEFRPTFLWPRSQRKKDSARHHVTFTGATSFMKDLLATIAALVGQKQDVRQFHLHPMKPDVPAARFWEAFHDAAERMQTEVPKFAEGAVGKHCFTTTGHVTAGHILRCAFSHMKANRADLPRLRIGDPEYLASLSQCPLLEWPQISSESMLCAPEHVWHMLYSILVIRNEMRLPREQRAGALDDPDVARRRAPQRRQHQPTLVSSNDEEHLGSLLRECLHDQYITVTMANRALPAEFKSNQFAICRLFDLAQRHGAGQREGSPLLPGQARGGPGGANRQALRLRLTLGSMSIQARNLFGVAATTAAGSRDAAASSGHGEAPPMSGRGVAHSGVRSRIALLVFQPAAAANACACSPAQPTHRAGMLALAKRFFEGAHECNNCGCVRPCFGKYYPGAACSKVHVLALCASCCGKAPTAQPRIVPKEGPAMSGAGKQGHQKCTPPKRVKLISMGVPAKPNQAPHVPIHRRMFDVSNRPPFFNTDDWEAILVTKSDHEIVKLLDCEMSLPARSTSSASSAPPAPQLQTNRAAARIVVNVSSCSETEDTPRHNQTKSRPSTSCPEQPDSKIEQESRAVKLGHPAQGASSFSIHDSDSEAEAQDTRGNPAGGGFQDRRESRHKRPTATQAWKELQAWGLNPTRSGEPFPLVLAQRAWKVKSGALMTASCSKNSCPLRSSCKFVVNLSFDKASAELVFQKQGPHEGTVPVTSALKLGAGFKAAAAPESLDKAPSHAQALKKLEAWGSDTSLSGEPFPLHVKDRTSPSAASLARVECRPNTTCCKNKCKFVAAYFYFPQSSTGVIGKKNGHAPVDELLPTEDAWQRRLPLSESQWRSGESRVLKPEEWCRGVKDLKKLALQWSLQRHSNGFDKAFHIRASLASQVRKPRTMRAILTCSACAEQTACSWVGEITVDTDSNLYSLRHYGKHSPSSQVSRYNTMTSDQEAAFRNSKATTAMGKLAAVCRMEDPPPDPSQVQSWLKRQKKLERAASQIEEEPDAYTVAHVDLLLDQFGLKSLADTDDDLEACLLGRSVWEEDGKERCAFAFGSRESLRILGKLKNKRYIILCGDATWKQLFAQWCLIPIGVVTKRYGKTTQKGSVPSSAWASHLSPVIWVVASGELAGAYMLGFSSLIQHTPAVCPDIDIQEDVKQFNADLTATAEKARQRHLKNSIRGPDFWHCLVKVSETLEAELVHKDESGKKKKYYSEIIAWVHMTRTQCMLLTEHHNLWAALLKHYRDLGEGAAMQKLLERYFLLVPVEVARDVYGVRNPSMLEDGKLLCAFFWCGLQRYPPGAPPSSQCAEVGHKVQGHMIQTADGKPLRNASPPQFFPGLQTLIRTVSQQYKKIKPEGLPDVPLFADPKLMSGKHLARQGRTGSVELYKARQGTWGKLVQRVEIPSWGHVFVMPRSLLKLEKPDPNKPGKWVRPPKTALSLSEDKARMLAEMALEKDGKRLYRLWAKAGILNKARRRQELQIHSEKWTENRYEYVIVLWGSAADKLWRRPPAYGTASCLCNCTPFALWAGCEHEQCVRAIEEPSFKLTTPGQNKGGRGKTNLLHFKIRTTSAKRLRWARAQHAKKQRAAARKANPQVITQAELFDQSTWQFAAAPLSLKSDQGVRRPKRKRTRSTASDNSGSGGGSAGSSCSESNLSMEFTGAEVWDIL